MSDVYPCPLGREGSDNHIIRPKGDVVFWQVSRAVVTVAGVSDDEGVDEENGEDEEYGERKPEKMHDPREPSSAERKEHELTHLPFRSWCKHCVNGRGKEKACQKQEKREGESPEIHLDFMFMGEPKGGKTLTMVVAKERRSRMIMCCVVPMKSSGEFAAKRVVAFMKEVGLDMAEINVKTDNEPAIKSLVEKIGNLRATVGAGRMVVETSPVGSSKSNGSIERGIQSVQGMMRTMRSAIEERLGVELEVEHAIWTWIAEYSGWLLNRCEVSKDGKTNYERCKGKRAKVEGFEFGEGVHWKHRPAGGPLGKLATTWHEGIFLGKKGSTGETIVGDARGVFKTRTVRRKPESERWNVENMKFVSGVPWRVCDDDPNMDGEKMKMDVKVMNKHFEENMKKEEEEKVPRRMDITKRVLEQHGYTQKCQGCRAVILGHARQGHSEGCRARLEKAARGGPEERAAAVRIDAYLEKVCSPEMKKADETEGKKRRRTEAPKEEEAEEVGPYATDRKGDDPSRGRGRCEHECRGTLSR